MKIVNIEKIDPKIVKTIFDKLAGRRFIAISLKDDGTSEDHWYRVSDEEAIFQLELLKHKIMEDHRS